MQYAESLKSLLDSKRESEINFEPIPLGIMKATKLPKYLRINAIKMSPTEGIRIVKELSNNARFDEHIPALVTVPSTDSFSFGEHSLVKSGHIIIQDKASCFPSQILFGFYSRY